jgi:hypothetical protein
LVIEAIGWQRAKALKTLTSGSALGTPFALADLATAW